MVFDDLRLDLPSPLAPILLPCHWATNTTFFTMMRESKEKKRAKIAKKHANILMPKVRSQDGITNDDEIENDIDNYEDSRIELRESGHNLVCGVFIIELKLKSHHYKSILILCLTCYLPQCHD